MKTRQMTLLLAAMMGLANVEAEMKSAPVWTLKAPWALDQGPLEIPASAAIRDVTGFTAQMTVRFGEIVDRTFMPLLSHELGDTGWGLGVMKCSSCGNPVLMRCNGATHGVSYGMGSVKSGSTHTFVFAVRKGIIAVYMDGRRQCDFFMKPTPVPESEPIRVGQWDVPRWQNELFGPKPMKGLVVEDLRFWGPDEEFYLPGESHEVAVGFAGGKGWMIEAATKTLPGKPNLLIYGDSVSDGYAGAARAELKNEMNVYHWTHCEGKLGRVEEHLYEQVLGFAQYDLIAFNNGGHSYDWAVPSVTDEQIADSYRLLVATFRKYAPKAKLMFLSTTPHTGKRGPSGKVEALGDQNYKIIRLNRVACQVMAEERIPVVDAYGLMVANLSDARGDQYHFNPPLYQKLAKLVGDQARQLAALTTARPLRERCQLKSAPLWDLTKDGGPLAEEWKRKGCVTVGEKGFDIPSSAVPDQSAFTVEATLVFHELADFRLFPILSQELSETGWGLALLRCSDCGNPVLMRCNGGGHSVCYSAYNVRENVPVTFTLTARKGVIVIYVDGKPQRSFFMKPTPVPEAEPIRFGYAPAERWLKGLAWAAPKPMRKVELRSLKFWDGQEEYYAPGESRAPAIGFAGGVGWQMEVSAKADDRLPKVLYFGDSISDGYGDPLKEIAKGKLNLYHWTHFEGNIDRLQERLFDEVLAFAKYDVVVFNNGLHSLHWTADKVSDERIAKHYRMLVEAFRKRAPQAKLIYVNSTPLTGKPGPSGKVETLSDRNDMPLRLNRIAAKVMAAERIPVVDAYSLMAANLGDARGDQYHWNPPAYRRMAQLVFDRINECLGSSGAVSAAAGPSATSVSVGEVARSRIEQEVE